LRRPECPYHQFQQFYAELEHEQKELGYVIHIVSDVANKIRDGSIDGTVDWFNNPWAAIRGPFHKERQQMVRAMDDLFELPEHARSAATQFRKDADDLELKFQQLTTDTDGTDSQLGNPGAFLRQGIGRLNEGLDPGSDGQTAGAHQQDIGVAVVEDNHGPKGPVPVDPASPEQAAFIKDLHTAQGAGSMFHGAFGNARQS
jgi:hypothetical protein